MRAFSGSQKQLPEPLLRGIDRDERIDRKGDRGACSEYYALWVTVQTVSGEEGVVAFEDPASTTATVAFYRLREAGAL